MIPVPFSDLLLFDLLAVSLGEGSPVVCRVCQQVVVEADILRCAESSLGAAHILVQHVKDHVCLPAPVPLSLPEE